MGVSPFRVLVAAGVVTMAIAGAASAQAPAQPKLYMAVSTWTDAPVTARTRQRRCPSAWR